MTAKRKRLRKQSHASLAAETVKLHSKEERALAEEGLGVSDHERFKVSKVIIGERIRRRLSQTSLAQRMGVTKQQVSKLENGDFDHLGTLQKVLSVLGYHVRVSAIPLHREAHTHSSGN
jgi:DNA-binding XRE family transcriptional regulator